jgi:probable HAF family extracellular repeat protein
LGGNPNEGGFSRAPKFYIANIANHEGETKMKENKGGTTMKGLTLSFGLAVLACLPMSGMAQDTSAGLAPDAITYTFTPHNFPTDVFTQLLGINDFGTIAGYHGSGNPGHPNVGFTLTLDSKDTFTKENFPGAVQTQVIGINNAGDTDGFYIDHAGATHGFLRIASSGGFVTVDFPSTLSSPKVNQLLGLNGLGQAAGFYNDHANLSHGYIYARFGGVFSVFKIPPATTVTATGVNETGEVCGFYTDMSGVTHGFLLNQGTFTPLNFPGGTATQAFGLNNNGQVVGSYTDSSGMTHGFVWTSGIGFQGPIDDPAGPGATIINGINDGAVIVGFSGVCVSAPTGATTCNGFVATP